MSNPIDNLQLPTGPALFYDPSFRNTLEDHMNYLRNNSGTSVITIQPNKAIVYSGDLFGLLADLTYPAQYHWIIMRMNNYSTPTETDSALSTLIIPDTNVIDRILSVYKTQNKIKS